jgi:predicted phosphoribosyltransferase
VSELGPFLGPLGGLLAMTWGAGAMMGYGFAHKTIGKRVGELRDDMRRSEQRCDTAIKDLVDRVREVEDRYTHGMERQLGQARQSTVAIIERGVPTESEAAEAAQMMRDKGLLP